MTLPAGFLDQLRDAVTMSALVGRAVKLTRAGREFKACCPFHGEKTPSFTVNDDKQFGHCFGCGWHGDIFRWLGDHDGLAFIDAVREVAGMAGMDMPAPSPQAAERAARVETVRGALETAQAVYAGQIEQAGAVMEYLAGRGIGREEIAAFGLGYACGGAGSLKGRGIGEALGREAGLLVERSDGAGFREMFWDRITVPIHDARGRIAGFGARTWPGARVSSTSAPPKFINSPDGPLFDKGRLLFNLHRAAPLARAVKVDPANVRPAGSQSALPGRGPGVSGVAEGRLIIVEGYFDVIALARCGIHAAVAPMGTALTEAQLERAWRVHRRPVLLFDGDAAGQRAALRACMTALPALGPGRELAVALLPQGQDPDDLVRALGPEAARREIEALLAEARGVHDFVFEGVLASALRAEGAGGANVGAASQSASMPPAGGVPGALATAGDVGPERIAGVWAQLAEMAGTVADQETRAQYLGLWRARFEREVSTAPQVLAAEPMHAVTRSEDGSYAFPDSESDSAAKLIAIVRAVLKRREERRAITAEIADLMKMAEAIGFVKKEITAVVRDIESDLAHGPAVREEAEMARVLYRRALGIRGPMNEAMLPQATDPRPRAVSASVKRRAAVNALIDARAVEV